jgi:hypothetical protein
MKLKLPVDIHIAKLPARPLPSDGRESPHRRRPNCSVGWARPAQLSHFEVTANPTQGWLSGQMTEAFPWDTAPRYLLRDRDKSYGPAFRYRVRAMGSRQGSRCATGLLRLPGRAMETSSHDQRHRKLVRNRASPHRAVEGSNKTALAMIFKLAAARAAQ